MSEIRVNQTCMKGLEDVKEACEKANLIVKVLGTTITITNHGLKTYYNDQPINLIQGKDGLYEMRGDCSKSELEKLEKMIKRQYSQIVISKVAKSKFRMFQSSKTEVGGKIKLTFDEY
jgi:hypothetical protein